MDFNDSPKEAAFRKEVQEWLDANAEKRGPDDSSALSMFSERENPEMIAECKAWQRKKADAGWACITWPKDVGGRGGSLMENIIFGQEEAKYITPANIFMIGLGMAGPTIQVHGTPEQKKKWLPSMLRGDVVWCQLFSEPAAGSDLAGLRTRAVKDGDDWIVNGQKVWTSGAHYCRWGILVTRSDFDLPKHKGLTYFVVDMESPGIEVRPIKQITGGSNFNEVFFTDVRIPDENRLDRVGNGWSVSLTTLMNERMSIGGGMGIGSEMILAELQRVAEDAYVDGVPAKENPVVRQKIAEFYSRMKAMELTVNRTLSALSKGGMPGSESSIIKVTMGILLQEIAAFAMEMQGGLGAEFGEDASFSHGMWQELYLGIPAIRIAGGTDEVQRNIIGERVLGLPAEQRIDKAVPFNEIPTG
ncbi:MAG: acyl-CoA dehydrogenase family protein [Pseudomonadales bacterium]|nr:acyl-CoA dehydrogenase family protein [Pseudomonadales bacterium]